MRLATLANSLSLLAALGLLLPAPVRAADAAATVTDVALDSEGALVGRVIGAQGRALPRVAVALVTGGAPRMNLVSDDAGNFRVFGLRGGIYQIAVAGQAANFRVWTAAAAPPGAQSMVLLSIGDVVVRGQTPLPSYFKSEAFLIGTVIVAAIAVPIAIHNFRNDHPAGS